MTSGVNSSNVDTAVPKYLTTLLDDLDQTWGGWFGELGWGDPPAPGRVLIESGTSFATECIDEDGGASNRIPSDEANASFCGVDEEPNGDGQETEGSIVLPVDTFAAIWDGNVFGGAVADRRGGLHRRDRRRPRVRAQRGVPDGRGVRHPGAATASGQEQRTDRRLPRIQLGGHGLPA